MGWSLLLFRGGMYHVTRKRSRYVVGPLQTSLSGLGTFDRVWDALRLRWEKDDCGEIVQRRCGWSAGFAAGINLPPQWLLQGDSHLHKPSSHAHSEASTREPLL